VTAASTVGNALGYLLTLTAARLLGPTGFGTFAALLGLIVVGHVAALGVQTVAAKALVADPSGVERHRLEILATRAGLGVGALAVGLTWPLARFLHLPSAVDVLWVSACLLPQTWLGLQQGVAQGNRAYRALAVIVAVAASGKAAGGIAGALTGDPTAAIAGVALGTLLAAALSTIVVRVRPAVRGDGRRSDLAEAMHATHALLAFFVLANLDVLLARHFLPAATAGVYAVGAAIAKIAFWLPQSVGLVAFPHLVNAQTRYATLRFGVTVLAGVGLLVVATVAVFAGLLVALVGGPDYAGLVGSAWIFAAIGATLALAQLLLLDRLAQSDWSIVTLLWTCVLVEVAVVAFVTGRSLEGIAATTLAMSVGLVLTGLAFPPPKDQLAGQGPGL
jgi:O-antigen/teichoic acid export membrane protein